MEVKPLSSRQVKDYKKMKSEILERMDFKRRQKAEIARDFTLLSQALENVNSRLKASGVN